MMSSWQLSLLKRKLLSNIPTSNDIRFEVSTHCNYKCVICPHSKLKRKKDIMSFETFQMIFDKVMNETDQYTNVTFPGMGEPMMDWGLLEKMRYVKSTYPDKTVTFITNASMLNEDVWIQLEEIGVTSARVSFYGQDTEEYSRIMGTNGRFNGIVSTLEDICTIKDKTKLIMTMNVLDGEYDEKFKNWVKYWESVGVDLVEVWKPHNWVDSVEYRELQDDKLETCGRPFNGPLQIQVDGTVNMCCFDYDGHLTLGDLRTQSLEEIFSSDLYKRIVQAHSGGDFTGLICDNCDQRNKDKSDVMVYNTSRKIEDRVLQTSSTYEEVVYGRN